MTAEHALQIRPRFLLTEFERLAEQECLPVQGACARRRFEQPGQMVEMKHPGNCVLVERPLGLAPRKCRGGTVFEPSGAQILPDVGLRGARAGQRRARSFAAAGMRRKLRIDDDYRRLTPAAAPCQQERVLIQSASSGRDSINSVKVWPFVRQIRGCS